MPVVLASVGVDVAVLVVSAKKIIFNMDVTTHEFFRRGLFSLCTVTDMLILFCILFE